MPHPWTNKSLFHWYFSGSLSWYSSRDLVSVGLVVVMVTTFLSWLSPECFLVRVKFLDEGMSGNFIPSAAPTVSLWKFWTLLLSNNSLQRPGDPPWSEWVLCLCFPLIDIEWLEPPDAMLVWDLLNNWLHCCFPFRQPEAPCLYSMALSASKGVVQLLCNSRLYLSGGYVNIFRSTIGEWVIVANLSSCSTSSSFRRGSDLASWTKKKHLIKWDYSSYEHYDKKIMTWGIWHIHCYLVWDICPSVLFKGNTRRRVDYTMKHLTTFAYSVCCFSPLHCHCDYNIWSHYIQGMSSSYATTEYTSVTMG